MSRFNALIVLLLACGAVLVEGQLRCQNGAVLQISENSFITLFKIHEIQNFLKSHFFALIIFLR